MLHIGESGTDGGICWDRAVEISLYTLFMDEISTLRTIVAEGNSVAGKEPS
jgi:hypothetical protein